MTLLGQVADQGASVVLVTHDSAVARRANRALRLKDGVLAPLEPAASDGQGRGSC